MSVRINDREYDLRREPMLMKLNGRPVGAIVDLNDGTITVSDEGDPHEAIARTADAVSQAWLAELAFANLPAGDNIEPIIVAPVPLVASELPPSPSPDRPTIVVTVSGCYPAKLAYPATLDPQWEHLRRR